MPNSKDPLEELSTALSRLSTVEDKVAQVQTFIDSIDIAAPKSTALHHPGGGNIDPPAPILPYREDDFQALLAQHGVSHNFLASHLSRTATSGHTFNAPPCAFANPNAAMECHKQGKFVCTGCRLVWYCSQECQKKHWKLHCRDCKDPVRSENWVPAWVVDQRPPTFVTSNPRENSLSYGLALWGNMPAFDVLNLSADELTSRSSLDLAFVASGDLRNVIRTVNGIPQEYDGKVTILLNDHDQFVTLRNILILQMLGTIEDKKTAADIALHFWYSAFVPEDYYVQFMSAAMPFAINEDRFYNVKLGERAFLTADNDPTARLLCAELCSSTYGMGDAANELARVRFDASRVDLHHRQYCRLEPSHRISILQYRRFGIVLPFGGHDAHFNSPNRFLFSPQGTWLQTDHGNPLAGWDIEEVVKSGRAHGATREDVYGCLYFHVTDQLRQFIDRLCSLNIEFKVFKMDAVALSKSIERNSLASFGVPSTTRFDRIEVSNTLDTEYIGVVGVVDAWGKFLKRRRDATLVGYFMNWPVREPRAKPGVEDTEAIMRGLIIEGKIPLPPKDSLKACTPLQAKGMVGKLLTYSDVFCARYDNAKFFAAFLARQGLDAALKRNKLKRKLEHSIVPHRSCGPLPGPPEALPNFDNDESWYLQSNMGSPGWYERFIEISWA